MFLLIAFGARANAQTAQTASVRVEVQADQKPIAAATVVVNGASSSTNPQGFAVVAVAPGKVEITTVKEGFLPVTTTVQVAAGQEQRVLVQLDRQPTVEEEVVVVASTRRSAFLVVVVALAFLSGVAHPLRAAAMQRMAADAMRARAASIASACDKACATIALLAAGVRRRR